MQFTGLRDKNNKEIYEGDIVLADDRILSPYVVKYHPESLSYAFTNDNVSYIHFTATTLKEIKVIGNIFENPELLNKQTEAKNG